MYVEINSRSEFEGEPLSRSGKTTWVNDDDPKIELVSTSPKHIDSPPWHIEIEGQTSLENNGYRDGDIRTVTRILTVQLTPADLSKLLSLALEKGFTAEDLDLNDVLPPLIRDANLQTRKKLAFDILHGIDNADLLSFLSELLPSRPSDRL